MGIGGYLRKWIFLNFIVGRKNWYKFFENCLVVFIKSFNNIEFFKISNFIFKKLFWKNLVLIKILYLWMFVETLLIIRSKVNVFNKMFRIVLIIYLLEYYVIM